MKHVLLVMAVALYVLVWGQFWTWFAAALMVRAIYDDWRKQAAVPVTT